MTTLIATIILLGVLIFIHELGHYLAARSIGVRQIVSRDAAANAHVIPLRSHRTQARFDVAQAFPIGQLREGHRQKLVQAAEGADVEIASVFRDQTAKSMPRCELHDLCEHEIASGHRCLPGNSGKTAKKGIPISNR